MQGPGFPSLDQLRVFLTVVEAGSFAAAGRQLGRATSAISYAVANLEQQLGVALFDRERTKKPTLTEAGMAVLVEAKSVSVGIDNLRARVAGMLTGLEPEVSLVVDVMMPPACLVDVLKTFEKEFPTVALRLHVEILGTVSQSVRSRAVDIGIDGPEQFEVPDVEQIVVGGIEIIPVAAPTHPLAIAKRNLPGAARNHVQLVLIDRSDLTKGRDFGVIGLKTWRLADLNTKHELLLAGVGWGGMPEPMVREDIAAGRLKRLDLPEGGGGYYGFRAIHRTDTPPGPAASWIIQRFQSRAEIGCKASATSVLTNPTETSRIGVSKSFSRKQKARAKS